MILLLLKIELKVEERTGLRLLIQRPSFASSSWSRSSIQSRSTCRSEIVSSILLPISFEPTEERVVVAVAAVVVVVAVLSLMLLMK